MILKITTASVAVFCLLFSMAGFSGNSEPAGGAGADTDTATKTTLLLKQSKKTAEPLLTRPLSGADFFGLLVGMLFVLATIVAIVWLIKRFGRLNYANHSHLQIVAAMNLGAREKVILLQVGEQQILVGATPTSIRTLHRLDQPLSKPAPGEPFSLALSEKLKNMLGKK